MPYKVDFKQLATEIDIADVARLLKLQVVKDRAHCPVCDSDRSIQLYSETNSFRCHKAEISGDCIALYAHLQQDRRVGANPPPTKSLTAPSTPTLSPKSSRIPTRWRRWASPKKMRRGLASASVRRQGSCAAGCASLSATTMARLPATSVGTART